MGEFKRTYCGLCHPRCGILLEMENGRAVKAKGDPDHPVTRGAICGRGRLMPDHVHHPDRLNYPLKRVGARGEGKWQRLTWEQALDEAAERLENLRGQYGAETLTFTHGTKRTYHWDGRRFFNLFGSPNTCGVNNICMCPSYATEYATYGGMGWSDLMNSSLALIWGRGASESDPIGSWATLVRRKKKGLKIIVVDPRRIREAEIADLWLPIRPGTDVALMLGWIRYIIKEDLYDHEFVENYTTGLEDVRAAAEAYTPEKVAEITGLTPGQVMESAHMYASVKPGAIPFGYGLDKQGVNANQCARGRAILRALTGNLEVPGGDWISESERIAQVRGEEELELNEVLSAEQRAKQLYGSYPFFGFPGWERTYAANRKLPHGYLPPPLTDVACLANAPTVFNAAITGEPYPIKAMITLANNPLLAFPNPRRVFEAINSLDLYLVMDYYLTPSAALADYVFPASSTVEQPELWLSGSFCLACPPALDPLFERRNSYDFYRGLGLRLGQAEHWPWENMEAVYDHCLEPVGYTFQKLADEYGIFGPRPPKRYEKYGFGTPSGKVELKCSIFEDLGLEPVPVYREPKWSPVGSPDLAREYPLIMITGSRFMPMYHSEQRQIEAARKSHPDPLVNIHPDTAASLGLAEGDRARVSNPAGSIEMIVHLTDVVRPDTIDVQHGWWFPERDQTLPELFGVFESNANLLCPDDPEMCSPEIGSWPHSALLARVDKI